MRRNFQFVVTELDEESEMIEGFVDDMISAADASLAAAKRTKDEEAILAAEVAAEWAHNIEAHFESLRGYCKDLKNLIVEEGASRDIGREMLMHPGADGSETETPFVDDMPAPVMRRVQAKRIQRSE